MSDKALPLRVAIIGVGMVAETHLMAVADLSTKLQLMAVVSTRQTSADAFADKCAATTGYRPATYTGVNTLVAEQQIDMAIVLTPPNARQNIVEALAAAGIPILMEKPVERNSDNALQLVTVCESAGVPLGIVFQHRVRQASRELNRLMSQQVFGRLALIDVKVPWWRDQAYYDEPGRGTYERDGGGVLISQAIHTLDLMLSLTAPVSQVQAMATTTPIHLMEAEDYVTASLRFTDGSVGSVIASTASYPGDAESIQMHFEKASVLLKSGVLTVSWRDGRVEHHGADASTGGGADPMAFTHDWHRDIIDDFADALLDKRPPLVTGREALRVHRLIDAMIRSSTDGAVVSLQ